MCAGLYLLPNVYALQDVYLYRCEECSAMNAKIYKTICFIITSLNENLFLF